MAAYNKWQINSMRQDAIRRSREMYMHSTVNSSHYSQGKKENEEPAADKSALSKDEHKAAVNINHTNDVPKKDVLTDNIGKLFKEGLDSDRITILAVIYLLIREGADMKLVLALAYILL